MFTDQIRATIRKYNLISRGDKIIAGVSGGPDSCAMLLGLHAISKEFGFSVHVAHFDHGVRHDSSRDARFVKALSDRLALPCTIGKPCSEPGTERGSMEETWRKQRLDFFGRVARGQKTRVVALAHTRDDQAETVLMRVIRGTGLYGLAGIIPRREMNGLVVIRPLLEVTRADVERYLKRRRVRARVDPTNAKDLFFRNKIRNRLLPLLKKTFNPGISEALARLGESAGQDYDFLNRKASALCDSTGRRIPLLYLRRAHPALRRIAYRNAIAAVAGSTRRITLKHTSEIEDLLLYRPAGSVVHLPREISCVKKKSHLVFARV